MGDTTSSPAGSSQPVCLHYPQNAALLFQIRPQAAGGALSQCAWQTLRQYFQAALPDARVRPGVILSIQTYGRTCNYHPHLHLLVSDGAFDWQGTFYPMPYVDTRAMEALFRHKVLRMLLARDKITAARVERFLSWRHSGFNVHRSAQVQPTDAQGRETVAAYLLHAPISQQRMRYDPSAAAVYYQVCASAPSAAMFEADANPQQTWTALDWLCATGNIGNKVNREHG